MVKRAIGTPIVGVYDAEKKDFLQHAPVNKAQTYGHIPESYNLAWEARPDDDGVNARLSVRRRSPVYRTISRS